MLLFSEDKKYPTTLPLIMTLKEKSQLIDSQPCFLVL